MKSLSEVAPQLYQPDEPHQRGENAFAASSIYVVKKLTANGTHSLSKIFVLKSNASLSLLPELESTRSVVGGPKLALADQWCAYGKPYQEAQL